jgi:predicted SnoaL-like aldol condensation-catalyzing enzyme
MLDFDHFMADFYLGVQGLKLETKASKPRHFGVVSGCHAKDQSMQKPFQRILVSLFGALFALTVLQSKVLAQTKPKEKFTMSQAKQQVVALLKSIETGDSAPVAHINSQKYIQHNLAVGDGLAGFGAVMQMLPKGSGKASTVRVFQDGDFVFAHTDYNFFGPKIGFDIFRFENGKIVEHWDNLQEKAAKPNPSGHTMIDGSTEVLDIDKTQTNKTLVNAFVSDILLGAKYDKLPQYIDANNYTQHNPAIADGLGGLSEALAAMAKAGVTMKYTKVHKVLGEGNFVLTVSEGEFAGKHSAFYDLFRVAGGKIVEHWDVIETIPPRADWKNANGKFGF